MIITGNRRPAPLPAAAVVRAPLPRRIGRPRAAGEIHRGDHVQRPDGTWALVEHADPLGRDRQGHDKGVIVTFNLGGGASCVGPFDRVPYPAGSTVRSCRPAAWITYIAALRKGDQ